MAETTVTIISDQGAPVNILTLSDRQLADLRQSIANEAKRRTQIAVNGHDSAAIIWGNELSKRAITVAAAGKHSILFLGPHNSGKTMLRAMCLELGIEESYEARHCPCGNYGDPFTECSCTVKQIEKVIAKLPVVDITVEVRRPAERDMNSRGTSLAEIRDVLDRAGHFTEETLDDNSGQLLKAATREMGFDIVMVARILQVARTIANLDDSQQIHSSHIAEAINYRLFGR